ncbi:alpha/beta hydrolase family protein [Pseudomonas sp. NCHU5208]|uniref:alpha/beta hydrolase family protein n=1 Tax=unclassified Pseudomonas TaxID=196821 RepID=UPI003F984DF0
MRPTSAALLAFGLLFAAMTWAEEPADTTAPASESPAPTSEERPPLPERSVLEAQALEERLDKREQQMLKAQDESFLTLWLPANVGEPEGVVILLPGDVENADEATVIGPLRRKLPDAGWHSLSLTLPDPEGAPLPPRSAAPTETPPAEPSGETHAAQDTPPQAAPATPAADEPAVPSPEQRREAHAQRVMARIDAAVAFAAERQAKEIVLLGHGSGGYWAMRYLNERKPDNLHNLLLVAAEVPAGFTPPLDELVAKLPVATGDFYYKDRTDDRQAAVRRLNASKRAKLPVYIQVAMKALPGNLPVQEEQLFRRLRGWLKLHIRTSGS